MPLLLRGWWRTQNSTRQALKTHDINDILKRTKDMNPSFRDDYAQCVYIYIRVPWYKRALLHRTSPTNHHENTCDPENIKGSSTSCKTLAQGSDGIPQVTEVFRSEPDRQWISWSWNIHWFNGWLFHVFFPSNYVAVRVKFANSGRRTNWTSEFL